MTRHLLHLAPPEIEIRLTIPAREAIEQDGPFDGWRRNVIDRPPYAAGIPIVTLWSPPPADTLMVVIVGRLGEIPSLGARLPSDGPWPGEFPAGWAERGAWVPCPTCGAALLWCEAGFVPGWRICLAGHASQLSGDGRSAKRHAAQDASTLRATRPL